MSKHCVNHNSKEVKDIATGLGIHPAIAASKIGVWQERNNTTEFPTLADLWRIERVKFGLKVIETLNSNRAIEVFNKGAKAGWDLKKILTELQVPKDQVQLVLDLGITDREQLALELASNYNFGVNITQATKPLEHYDSYDEMGDYLSNIEFNKKMVELGKHDSLIDQEDNPKPPKNFSVINDDGRVMAYFDTEREADKYAKELNLNSPVEASDYHKDVSVPGGVLYTESEISSPLITPIIKGHGRFSSEKGMGWFRSDELPDDGKTRRILEIQSDIFQKGRNMAGLVGNNKFTDQNNFLQLLNKNKNWVEFFTKSIIQESKKRGYTTVLFPTGETAAKIETMDTEGLAQHHIDALARKMIPISDFYENKVGSILNKIVGKNNVERITDEYGNTWNKITIDNAREIDNVLLQQSNSVSSKASPETLAKVKDFLNRIGVNVESVKQVVVEGKKLDDNAVANITQSLIQVVNGKEAESLTEEAMHFAVEILEQKNPTLFKQLLKEINSYNMYKQVLVDYSNNPYYQTPEGKPDILKLKKEAIGKILAEVVINHSEGRTEKPELQAKTEGWWSKILQFIKNLFSTSGFDQASMDILAGKNIGTAKDITGKGYYYQQASTSKQDQIFNDMMSLSNSIEKTDDGYAIDGRKIKTRVSNLVQDWYARRFTEKSLVQSEYTQGVNDLKAEKGTAGHADLEHIFEIYVDKSTGLLREFPLDDSGYISQINPNNPAMYDILKENLKQRLYTFPTGTKFMSEITIYDSKRDIAGTVDFLAISPEGKVSILDWKFMDLNTNKYNDIPWYKINAWNTQMEQYKYIISRVYGVKNENFQQTRMIPIKAIYTEGNPKNGVLPALQSIKIGDVDVKNITEDYLIPVGLEGEKTGIRKVDILIEKLNAIYKKLSEEKVTPGEKSNKAEQLNALFSAIRQLQMKQNIKPLVYQAKVLNKQIQSIIDTYNNKFKGKESSSFTDAEISSFSESIELARESLNTYINLDTELKFLFNGELSDEEKELREDLRETVDNAREYADILGGEDGIDQEFITNFIGSTAAPEKIIRGMTKFFGNTATIQLKGLETLFKKANKAFALSGMDVLTEVKKLTALKNAYQNWAKGKGLTKSNQFDIIKKKNSNELIDEYNPKFYSELKKNIDDKNYAWIRDNIDHTAYKEALTEKKEREFQRISEKPRAGTEMEIKYQINREKEAINNLYNISTPESPGWLLYNDISKFPVKNKWESPEWKELHKPENKPALDFYNYILEKNKEYTDIGYIHAKQTRTFLPWVRKGFTEKVIFGGKLSLGEEFLRNISMDEGDTGYGKIDPLTGKPVNNIPKYLTSQIDGEVSSDLFKTMAMYNEFAIKFKYLSDIEAQGRALIRLEKNKKAIATSYFGKTEYKDGVLQYNPDNSENAKIIEDMVKAIIYQQQYIQSDTFDQVLTSLGGTAKKINDKLGFNILPENMEGRQVSVNKIITQMNNNFQVMTLGLNPLSSISNLFGGKTQSFINSGKYFTKSQFVDTEMWLLANKMGGEDKQKMLAALDYFIPFTDNYNRDAGKDLSLSNLTDQHVQDFLMWMMRHSEEAVQKTNFFAYLRNSVVVDGKVMNTREYLRTTDEFRNMYQGTESERSARQAKFEQSAQELNESSGVLKLGSIVDGEFVIPGIDRKSDSVIELRRKVQQFTSDALGNLTEENKRLVNLNVYGKSFMVFKNWIPRLVDVRMGNLKYNAGSDAYEWGRSRMMYRIITEDLTKSINNLSNTLKGNEKGIDFIRQLFEKKKSDYETDTGKELEMTETEFIDLVRQNTKNQMVDLLFYAGLMALTLGIKALPPDDDENPIVTNQYKFLLKATDKIKDEIGYFYDPTSLTSLISGSIFPSIQMLENYKKALGNFMIENYAIAIGDEKLEEKNHVVKYWMKSFKWTNQASQLLPMFSPELAKDMGIKMQSQYGIR